MSLPRLPPDVILKILTYLLPADYPTALSLIQTNHENYITHHLIHSVSFQSIPNLHHYHFITRHLPRLAIRHLQLSAASLHPSLATPWEKVIPQLAHLSSISIPVITDLRSLHSVRAVLTGSATHLTLFPNKMTCHIHTALLKSRVTHISVLPHDAWFGISTETLLSSMATLTHAHVTYPPRIIHHEIITAISTTARNAGLNYQASIPFYDYLPFHTAHSEAPIRRISLGIVRERFACLFRDIVKWRLLERVWIHSCTEEALSKVIRALSGRVWRVVMETYEKPEWIGCVPGGWASLRRAVVETVVERERGKGAKLELCDYSRGWGGVRVGLWLYGLGEEG